MDLAPGTIFAGDYRVERPLSAGGMGAVYLATQLSTGKPRALKLMHRELVFDPESRQHFEQEARVGARIASEHVVEVQAAGVDAVTHLPYLVMELLEGEDMATRLRRGPFTLVETATIFEQLCHALIAAHDAGVVHRDLKPENVFLAVSKRTGMQLMVKVLDFGLAKVTEGQTRTTAALGTPLWLAPEQTERGVITPAADVWAMGLLAFTMLTGRIFWLGGEGPDASVTRVMREIVFDPIPIASARAAQFGKSLPPGFDAWFARCVARDPRARYQNARAAYQELAPVLRGGAHVAVSPTGATLVAGDGQYAPTQDAIQAMAPIPTPPPAVAPMAFPMQSPTVSITGRGDQVPKSSAGCVIAILAVLVLVAGAGAAAFFFISRTGLDASRTTEAPDAGAPLAVASSAPRTAETPAPSAPPMPSAVPDLSELFGGDAGLGAMGFRMPKAGGPHFGGTVQSSDAKLQDDAEDQFNDKLAAKFDACLAAHPQSAASGGLSVVAHVDKTGAVDKAQVVSMVPGPLVTCVRDVVKSAHFAAPARATEVTFALFWMTM
jgi:hypothetical protein